MSAKSILTVSIFLLLIVQASSGSSIYEPDLLVRAKAKLEQGVPLSELEREAYETISLGLRNPVAPARRDHAGGPDEFGYRWIDSNEDGGPEFAWIDITEDGDRLQADDDWNSGVIELGFTFPWYDQEYESIRVCSNGWITFNPNEQSNALSLPQAPNQNAPNSIILVNCYDIDVRNGGGIYFWTNEEDMAVIEWDRAPRYGDANRITTMEIVLKANGVVLLQYGAQQNINPNDVNAGFESPDGADGLSIWYHEDGRLEENLAVRISAASGWVTGTVVDLETEAPLEGATLLLSDGSEAVSDADGVFWMSDVLAEIDYTLTATMQGYNPVTSEEFRFEDQDTVTINFSLPHPEIRLDVEAIGAQLPQFGVREETFNVINEGNGPLAYTMEFTVPAERRDDFGDVIFEHGVSGITGDNRIRGMTTLGDEFYLTGSNNNAEPNYIYVIDREGEEVRRFEQPQDSASAIGMKGIASDGDYLYSADGRTIYKFTPEGEAVGTIPGPVSPSRHIAYDPGQDHFFVCDVTNFLYEIDRGGNLIQRFEKPMRVYGLSWHPEDPDSSFLYLLSRVPDGSQLRLDKMNTATGRYSNVTEFTLNAGDIGSAISISNSFNPLIWLAVLLVENGVPDRVVGVELSLNTSWVEVTPMQGTVEAESSLETDVRINAGNWMPGSYELILRISSNAIPEIVDLPLSLTVTEEGLEPEHFAAHETEGFHQFSISSTLIRGERAAWGDEIGIFTPNGLCVGASLWFDQPTQIRAYADDPATDEVDGFAAGEEYSFVIWDADIDREFTGRFTLTVGDETFREGGSTRGALSTPGARRALEWSLPIGWSLISANFQPDIAGLEDIFAAPVAGGNLILVKNGAGQFYAPHQGFNNIGDWSAPDGYFVKLNAPVQFRSSGDGMDGDNPINLNEGWNQIAYYPAVPIAAEQAFAPLGDNLIVAKDGAGRFYYPRFDFSNIGSATPGWGYQVKVAEATEFRYPQQALNALPTSPPLTPLQAEVTPTGRGMSLLVLGKGIEIGSEIAAFASDGKMVGVGAANLTGRLGLSIWGDDPTTIEIDGLVEEEPFSLAIWKRDGWSPLGVSSIEGGLNYTTDGLAVVAASELIATPTTLTLDAPYPNPFNGLSLITFTVPKTTSGRLALYDLSGRQAVVANEGQLSAGTHAVVLDAAELPSGTYLLRLETGLGDRAVKAILIR